MRIRTIVAMAALTPLCIAGSAAAQTTQSLGVSSTPVTSSVSPGTGVALGTVTLTSPNGGFTVNTVPVNLTPGGGGLANNLSNCLVYNTASGSTSALGPTFATVSGANSFALSSPLTINAGSPVTLQIRCDVASSTPSGSTFQFLANPSIGTSTSGAALAAEAEFVKQLPAGLSNAIVGIITLDATKSNQSVTVNSLPIAVSASGGADLSALTNCSLSNLGGTRLTTGGNIVTAITGSNTLAFDTPLNIPAGQASLVMLKCDVAKTAPVGSQLTVSFSPSAFQATSNGNPVTVTQGFLSNGQPGTNNGVIAIAPVGTQQGSVGTPQVPGTPNTGAGGNAALNFLALAALALVAFLGARTAMRS